MSVRVWGTLPLMNKRMGRVPAVLIVSGMSVGLVASGMSSASAVDATPRISKGACAKAAEEGYTTGKGEVRENWNTTCRIKKNGMWQWTKKKGNKCIKVKTSFRKLSTRGDARRYATYTFVKGNRVITKSVRIKSGKRAKVKICLPKKGKWGVVAKYRGSVISSLVKA